MTALDLISHVTATIEPASKSQITNAILRIVRASVPHADKIIPTHEDDHIEVYVLYKQQTAWLRYWYSGTSEYIEAWGNMADPVRLFDKRHAALTITAPDALAKEFFVPAAQALAKYLKTKTATATIEPLGENRAHTELVKKRISEALAPLGLKLQTDRPAFGPEDIGGWFDGDSLSTSLMSVEVACWGEPTYSCQITCGGMGAGPRASNVKLPALLRYILKTLRPVKAEIDTALRDSSNQKDFERRVRELMLRLRTIPPNRVSTSACNAYWRAHHN